MRFTIRLAAVGLAVFGAMLLASSHVRAQSEQSTRGLEGTWRATVTVRNCATGAPLASFHALLAFARGGTLSGASTSPVFQPGQFSPSYGSWRQTGPQAYVAVTDAFILFSGGPFVAGRQEITHTIVLSADGSQFHDDAAVDYFDANDAAVPPTPPLIPGCATAEGRRFDAQ